jgi:hypothetical protein
MLLQSTFHLFGVLALVLATHFIHVFKNYLRIVFIFVIIVPFFIITTWMVSPLLAITYFLRYKFVGWAVLVPLCLNNWLQNHIFELRRIKHFFVIAVYFNILSFCHVIVNILRALPNGILNFLQITLVEWRSRSSATLAQALIIRLIFSLLLRYSFKIWGARCARSACATLLLVTVGCLRLLQRSITLGISASLALLATVLGKIAWRHAEIALVLLE